MPTHSQVTVEAVATSRGFGTSDTATLQGMFPASPIYAGDLTADSVEDMGNDLLLGTEVNDGGHTFGIFNRDFINAPNPADVVVGGGGLPGSAYAPAPGSPGPGSMNPTDIPAPPAGWPGSSGTEYGVGDGLAAPSIEAPKIAAHTIGDYLFGKSSV